jgi:hypothetical protein
VFGLCVPKRDVLIVNIKGILMKGNVTLGVIIREFLVGIMKLEKVVLLSRYKANKMKIEQKTARKFYGDFFVTIITTYDEGILTSQHLQHPLGVHPVVCVVYPVSVIRLPTHLMLLQANNTQVVNSYIEVSCAG